MKKEWIVQSALERWIRTAIGIIIFLTTAYLFLYKDIGMLALLGHAATIIIMWGVWSKHSVPADDYRRNEIPFPPEYPEHDMD